jgi:hypothetical protein
MGTFRRSCYQDVMKFLEKEISAHAGGGARPDYGEKEKSKPAPLKTTRVRHPILSYVSRVRHPPPKSLTKSASVVAL